MSSCDPHRLAFPLGMLNLQNELDDFLRRVQFRLTKHLTNNKPIKIY